MTDFDIQCMNYEYSRRKLKGNIMTNGEKYAGESHNHYVFERMCLSVTALYVGANHQILESAKSKISMIMNNG